MKKKETKSRKKKSERESAEFRADEKLYFAKTDVKEKMIGVIVKYSLYLLGILIFIAPIILYLDAYYPPVSKLTETIFSLFSKVDFENIPDWVGWIIIGLIVAWWIMTGVFEYTIHEDGFMYIQDWMEDKDDKYNEEHTYDEVAIVGNRVEVHTHESHRNIAGWVTAIFCFLSPVVFAVDGLITIIFLAIKYSVLKNKLKKLIAASKD